MSHASNAPQPATGTPTNAPACPKCGTTMNAQAVNRYHAGRKGHGLLFAIFSGLWYWLWLGIKWLFQFIYKLLVWVVWLLFVACFYVVAAIANIIRVIRRQPAQWNIPGWITAIAHSSIRRSRRERNVTKTVWVCPNCGNTVRG